MGIIEASKAPIDDEGRREARRRWASVKKKFKLLSEQIVALFLGNAPLLKVL